MLPASWKPVPVEDLVRVGPAADGGYVVSRRVLESTDLLVGLGLFDDWRFEAAFKAAAGCDVVCYDHTVDTAFWAKRFLFDAAAILRGRFERLEGALRFRDYGRFFDGRTARHVRRKVGYDGPSSVSLRSILADAAAVRIFLKIDIEGSEYRILEQILPQADRIVGIAVEFHDVDLHRDRITNFIAAAAGRYQLVHVHANNFGGVDPAGDPLVLEMTWIRRDLAGPLGAAGATGAAGAAGGAAILLDFPNNPDAADIPLTYQAAA